MCPDFCLSAFTHKSWAQIHSDTQFVNETKREWICVFLWLSGRALCLQHKRLWVQFPGNWHTDKKCIAWMYCKSLWIKASAKCINVNVNLLYSCWGVCCLRKTNQSGIKFEVPWDKWHARIKKLINLESGIDRETPKYHPMRGKVNI